MPPITTWTTAGPSGVSMKRWRTQAITPSSTITTPTAIDGGRLDVRDQIRERVPQPAQGRHDAADRAASPAVVRGRSDCRHRKAPRQTPC